MKREIRVFRCGMNARGQEILNDFDYHMKHVNRLMAEAEEEGFVIRLTKP